jgi:CubicO group peptidase (beta-lactamase class C family)
MTAVLIGMLVEQGKLDWGTTLPDALPDKADQMHADVKAVTIDHLLAHRSGLQLRHPARPPQKSLDAARREPAEAREQRRVFVEFLLKQKPDAAPGASYAYSNAGYIILGAIIERLAGEPWEDVIRTRLFRPLRMASAGFGSMGTPGKLDQPCQHILRDGKHVVIEPGPYSDNPPALGPAGICHSSVGDWAKFLIAVVTGEAGGSRLLKPETWKRLHTPQFGGDYAGGWLVTQRGWGGRVLTHAGSNTMSYCVAWLAPDRRFGVGVMTNQGGDEAARACDEAASAVIGKWVGA